MKPAASSLWPRRLILAAVGALVLAVYAFSARSGMLEELSSGRGETYYNLLVRGFGSGRLSLAREVPAGLARLPDPYDPAANASYRLTTNGLHDLSYFRGRLYLYFGVTPALVLFGPYAALTGRFLYHREAALIFCFLGFLAGAGLLRAVQRRYFAATGAGVLAAGALLLGLGTGLPILLARSEVYEVSIGCGYLFVLLAWVAVWCALHRPEQRGRWLAGASVAYGLALGARPSLLAGAVVLLVPVFLKMERVDPNALLDAAAGKRVGDNALHLWPSAGRALLCALGPIALIGLGLLLYNQRRFGHAFEFGQHYQLASDRQDAARHFSPAYFWFNFRVYFLEPARWHGHFPFVRRALAPALPAGHAPVEDPFGALADIPVLWLAFAVPLAWRNRRAEGANLRRFVWAVALAGGASALTLCLFYGSCSRYEVEFLPAFGLLAAIGLLAVERALAGRPGWRSLARCGWGLLLGWSVMFNLLDAVEHHAEASSDTGMALIDSGRLPDAIATLRRVVRIDPELVGAHVNLGSALARSQRLPEAIEEFTAAIRLDPNNFEGQFSLGQALEQSGRLPEAIGCYQEAVRLKPGRVDTRYRLANALGNAGRLPAAAEQYAEALRILPGFAEARANLGLALAEMGRSGEAIAQLEQALRDKPGYPEAEAYLGLALAHAGRWTEAIDHYERALLHSPDDAELRYHLEMARRHQDSP